MIQARGRDSEGHPVVLLGLSDENVRRMRSGGAEGLGEPLRVRLEELGLPPMTIVIMAGKTDIGIQAIMEEFFHIRSRS